MLALNDMYYFKVPLTKSLLNGYAMTRRIAPQAMIIHADAYQDY
jgi:hypothetical protein